MLRAVIELLFTITAIVVARLILTSVLKGIANASANAFQQAAPNNSNNPNQARNGTPSPGPSTSNELHKDPVCGTYVADSTPFRRQTSGQTFYYCSDACREKHALVAR